MEIELLDVMYCGLAIHFIGKRGEQTVARPLPFQTSVSPFCWRHVCLAFEVWGEINHCTCESETKLNISTPQSFISTVKVTFTSFVQVLKRSRDN